MISTIKNFFSTKQKPLFDRIGDFYHEHGWQRDDVYIIGIRDTDKGNRDKFDDILCVVSADKTIAARGTTSPGNLPLKDYKKWGVDTIKTMCLGYYPDLWRTGDHKKHAEALGPDMSLIQVNPCKVFIDKNLNKKRDDDEELMVKNGGSGFNMHTQFVGDKRELINAASLGCQVWLFINQFQSAMQEIHKTPKWQKKKRNATFSYWLTSKEENPFYDEILKQARM